MAGLEQGALEAELQIQARVSANPNIVKVLGAIDDEGGHGMGLILELARFGDLYGILQDPTRDLPVVERLELMHDAATGIAALHANEPRIVHSDIKSSNFLGMDAGDGRIVIKAGDFGVATVTQNTTNMCSNMGVGTRNWTAPEVYEEHYKQSPASDVWSFGLVIYEFMTRKIPYDGLAPLQIMMKVCGTKELPDMGLIEQGMPPGLEELMRRCCNFDSHARQTMEAVVQDISAIQREHRAAQNTNSTTQPPQPPRSTRHHEDVLEMMRMLEEIRRAVASGVEAGQERIEAGIGRIESALEVQARTNRQILTGVLGLTNDECSYPRTFLVIPEPRGGGGGMGTRLKQMFEICDTYMIVFLCERTLRRIPYGKSEGLKFSALKEPLAKAAKAVDSIWKTFGPVIKFSAAAITQLSP